MAIHLITGLPGHGKTLWTIWTLKAKIEAENADLIKEGKEPRPVYYNGIPQLTLDWIEFPDPEKWHELPIGAIIIIDECQRTFRPRGSGAAVPIFVSSLETHRHQGKDLYLITQHPMLIDGNVRRLIDRHFHVNRPFGWSASTVSEFQGVKVDPGSKSNRQDAQRQKFVFPKEAFKLYKSAEVHTVKARIPGKLIFLILVPFIVFGLGYGAYAMLKKVSGGKKQENGQYVPGAKPDQIDQQSRSGQKMTTAEFTDSYNPRIPGLPHTASRYDETTRPSIAPSPDACISGRNSCKCYSQQGTQMDVSRDICLQIVEKGFFKDWAEPAKLATVQPGQGVAPMQQLAQVQIDQPQNRPGVVIDSKVGTQPYQADSKK